MCVNKLQFSYILIVGTYTFVSRHLIVGGKINLNSLNFCLVLFSLFVCFFWPEGFMITNGILAPKTCVLVHLHPFRHGKGLGQTCFSLCALKCPRSRFFHPVKHVSVTE